MLLKFGKNAKNNICRNFVDAISKELEDIQHELMLNPMVNDLRLQEISSGQDSTLYLGGGHTLSPTITERLAFTWRQKYQVFSNSGNHLNYGKSWMNMGVGQRSNMLFCRFFANEFSKRFEKDPKIRPYQAIPLRETLQH